MASGACRRASPPHRTLTASARSFATHEAAQPRHVLRLGSPVPPVAVLTRVRACLIRVPVALVAGNVGSIRLEADWKNLGSKAIRIEIDTVLAIIRPVDKVDAPDEKAAGNSEYKRGLLTADEMQWKAAGAGGADAKDTKAQSLFVQKIIDNVQISLKNVHIRYEDGISAQTSALPDPAKFFSLGLTIDELSINSAVKNPDGTWSNEFIKTPMQMMTKRIQLGGSSRDGGFAVYCNSGEAPWNEGGGAPIPAAEFMIAMRKMIGMDKFGCVDHVIRPIQLEVVLLRDKTEGQGYAANEGEAVSGSWRLISAASGSHTTEVRGPFRDGKYRYEPLNDVTVEMEEVSIVLASQTVTKFATLGSWATLMTRRQVYERWKPLTRRGLHRGSSRSDTREWWVFAKKCNDYDAKTVSVKWDVAAVLRGCAHRRIYLKLYSRKSAEVQGYEWALPLAEAEQKELQVMEDELEVSVTRTWRRLALKQMNDEARTRAVNDPVKKSWFGSSKSKFKELTAQEQEFLNSFEVETAEKQVYPEDWIETKINLTLNCASLTLEKEGQELAVINLETIKVEAEMRTDGGLTASVGLKSLTVHDLCSTGDHKTHFRRVVEPEKSRSWEGDQLLALKFEKKPLELPGVDMRVSATLQPLQIVFNPYFVEELVAFSKTGEDLALEASLTEGIQDSARARARALKRQTEVLKETALTVRTVMDLGVKLSAPTILVPADCSAEETDCIMISLGDLTIKSAKGTRDHDIFQFGLHDMQVQMLSLPRDEVPAPPMAIVEPVSMELELCNSVRPTDPSVPKLKLKGKLKPVRVAASDALLKRLLVLGDTIAKKRERAIAQLRSSTVQIPAVVAPKPKPAVAAALPRPGTLTQTLTLSKSGPKSMRNLLAKAHEKHKEEEKDELAQRLPFWDQLVVDFELEEIGLAISDRSGARELVVVKIQGLMAAVTVRPHDKHVVLGLRNFQVDDSLRAASLNTPCQLLSSTMPDSDGSQVVATTKNLLDMDFWDTEPDSPAEWRKTSCVPADCVGRKVIARFGTLSVNLHLGTVSKLLDLSKVAASATSESEVGSAAVAAASEEGATEATPAVVEAATLPRATLQAEFRAGGLCVQLAPELSQDSSQTVATLQLQNVSAYANIDDQGVTDVMLKVRTIEVLRGAPEGQHSESDYVLSVRDKPGGDEMTPTESAQDEKMLLSVQAVLQPETMPDVASVIKATSSGLDVQVSGPFVGSLLQWVNANPIGKEDTAKASEAAAKARSEAAAKAKEVAKSEVAKQKLMTIEVHLDAVTLSVPLMESADQVSIDHCLQVELGGIDVMLQNDCQNVEFRETWVKLKHGEKDQELLKPISGMLVVADKHAPGKPPTKNILLSGLTLIESHISFRDVIILQAIAGSMSPQADEPADGDPVAMARAAQQERLAAMEGGVERTSSGITAGMIDAAIDEGQTRGTVPVEPEPEELEEDIDLRASMLLAMPIGDVVERINAELEPEEAAEGGKIEITLPDELKLVIRIVDDCTPVTKPFLTAQAAIEGLTITQESGVALKYANGETYVGATADVNGCLILQLDGFDGSRGQSLPLLERFDLEFNVHQEGKSLQLAVGAQAVRGAPSRSYFNGLVQVQTAGAGEFVTREVHVSGKEIHIGDGIGTIDGLSYSDPKTARTGQPHAFRIDLSTEDSLGNKKYILSAATAKEKEQWIAMLCPIGTRAELTVTDSFLRDVQLTASRFKELQVKAQKTSVAESTHYGDCVLSNETGVLLYYGSVGETFDSARLLETGGMTSVSELLTARSEGAARSPRGSLTTPKSGRRTSRRSMSLDSGDSELTVNKVVKLWFPDQFDPANTKMVEYEASFTQTSAASFGAKSIEFELNSQGTGGANVLTLRGMVQLQNFTDTTVNARLQNGPPSSPRQRNDSVSVTLLVPGGGKVVGVPLGINPKSAYIQFSGAHEGAEWSDSFPLSELLPYDMPFSGSKSIHAGHRWLCLCGKAEPVRAIDVSSLQGGYRAPVRTQQTTIMIDPAMRIRNNIQPGVDLEYTVMDGTGGLGAVSEIQCSRILRCETRAGAGFFEKDYVVYVFELECTDGAKHQTIKRFSEFDDWCNTLDPELVKTGMYPTLPSRIEGFFKSAEEIQRLRQIDLNSFINDAIASGQRHPPVAQTVRSFLLSHLVKDKKDIQTDEGKVRFGAEETVALRHLESLNTAIDVTATVRLKGVEYTAEVTQLLSGGGEQGKSAPSITLLNRNGTSLRLRVDTVVKPTGAREFTINAEFCVVNHSGVPMLYHQVGDEQGLLGYETELKAPDDIENWIFGTEDSAQFPFSFRDPNGKKQLVICVKEGQAWQRTQPIEIDAVGSKGTAEVESGDKAKQFGVRISTAPGNVASKMVNIFPRFVVCNHIEGCEVDLTQTMHRHQHVFHPLTIVEGMRKGSRAVHFPRHTPNPADRLLSVRIHHESAVSTWSAGFNPQLGDFPLLLRNGEGKPMMIVRVYTTVHKDATVLVHLQEQWVPGEEAASDKYNFMLRNLSEEWAVGVRQNGITPEPAEMILIRYDSTNPTDKDTPFGWDRPPSARHPGLISIRCVSKDVSDGGRVEQITLECTLDELRVVRESDPRIELITEGATKVLRFSDDIAKPLPWHLGSRLGIDLDPRPELTCSKPECRHRIRASVQDGLAFIQNSRHNVKCEKCASVMWVTPPPKALTESKEDAQSRLEKEGIMDVEFTFAGLGLSIIRSTSTKNLYNNPMEELRE